METQPSLSPFAQALIHAFENKETPTHEAKITVNRFVSEVVSWYEKLRNAMDIRDDEVVLRSAIERILTRRLLWGQVSGKKIAEPLIRELLWARYFPDSTLPETTIHTVGEIIDLYLQLKQQVVRRHELSENVLNEWIKQLMACEVSKFLNQQKEKELMSNFMFQILKDKLQIVDDTEDTKNVQMFLAVRRAFAKDDIAFLRYHMFHQIFGLLTKDNVEMIGASFFKAYQEIEKQLHYPLKEKIYLFAKRHTPIFFILEDVLKKYNGDISSQLQNQEQFAKDVIEACALRYQGIAAKVRNAIIRSVFFLLLTKAVIAYGIEGTYEKFLYGRVLWFNMAINIGVPPMLMIVVSLFIRTPDQENSKRILSRIHDVLYKENPVIGTRLTLKVNPEKNLSISATIFWLLWIFAFIVSFGFIIYILTKLHFNIVSQGIFIFFLTIVSFLSFRINLIANMYKIEAKQSLFTPFVDFLFLPIIKVGMRLTEGISQLNVIIFVFDFLIEAPFKSLFGFFEKWFMYLHTKREDLG